MKAMNKISCIIGTAGHIDHGKTSLVKALTGIDADRLLEEKKRGVTIDIGFAHLDFDGPNGKTRAAIVDVPGHERFIRNMLAGTTGIDMALFVVAADDGVMPQTREHLDIIHLLGIKRGIFVITKSDLAGPERLDEVRSEISALIKDTALSSSPIVAASAATGKGIEELKKLIIEGLVREERIEGAFFRLPVDRSFSVKGFGAVVTGTVASGTVKKGEEILCYPDGYTIKVRGVQSLYLERESIASGERAALNISGVGHRDIQRGNVLISPELSPFIERAGLIGPWYVDAFFEFLTEEPVKSRLSLKVHHQTDESLTTIQFFGKKEAARGEKVFGRLILKKPLLMLKGDRFILRDPSRNRTIGGGVVYLPYLSKESARWAKGGVAVSEGDTVEEILLKVLSVTSLGFKRKSLSLMLNIREEELLKRLTDSKAFGAMGGYIVDLKKVAGIKRKAVEIISEHHKKNPTEAGIKEEDLFKALEAGSKRLSKDSVSVLKESIDSLISEKTLKRESNLLALSSHRIGTTGEDRKVEEAILKLFSNGFSAPALEEIRGLKFPRAEVDKMMAYLQRRGEIVKLKEGVFISGSALAEAKAKLTGHIKAKGGIKAAEFRDILGCGRKLAIEVLEYFDKERVTLRKDDIRVLR